MKKRLAGLAAMSLALTLAFGMTASAVGSVSKDSANVSQEALNKAAAAVTDKSTTVKDADGKEVKAVVTATAITPANVGAAEETLSAALKGSEIAQKGGGLVTGFDLSVTVDEKAAKNVTVTFAVDGVKAGGSYRILHYNGESWDVIAPTDVKAGYLTAHFDTLSPIVVIEVAKAENKKAEAVKVEAGDDFNPTLWAAAYLANEGGGWYTSVTDANRARIASGAAAYAALSHGDQVAVDNVAKNLTGKTFAEWMEAAGATAAPAAMAAGEAGVASPKTGEALPMAALMAAACLAGAIACARKARA